MSVLLLLLGIVTTAAGLALVASGVGIHDGTINTEFVTPGAIAGVGGLLLIGIGLAVRQLRRIERALAGRPVPRAARHGETLAATTADAADAAPRIPFPPKPKTGPGPQPLPPAGNIGVMGGEDAAVERLRAKAATLSAENASLSENADVSLVPSAPGRAEENAGEVKETASVRRAANGGAVARAVPRLDAKARASAPAERAKRPAFNAFWPVGPRRTVQTAAPQAAAPASSPSIAPVPAKGANSAAGDPAPSTPVSILKSGVVEGMAYTLYSDGSIEAQLPQGTLRFGSIAALRDHIESGS
jgi:hypothetical protein